MHDRNAIAPALLACGDRDLLPVPLPGRRSLAFWARDGGGGQHGLDLGYAELDAFPHAEVHPLAGRYALHQHDAQRRFALDGVMREDIDQDLQPLDRRDAGSEFAPAAVEERDLIASVRAQYMHRMVRAVLG